jgi:hypothetical protein
MSELASPPRLMDRVRATIRARHYSRRTEDTYAGWIKRYIFFHGKRHPAAMGAEEVNAFLTYLAVKGRVSASTQGQALSALVFLYRHVLDDPLPWLADIVRARGRRDGCLWCSLGRRSSDCSAGCAERRVSSHRSSTAVGFAFSRRSVCG